MTNSTSSRKQYTAQFKFDRAVEAIKTDNLSALGRKYGIGVNLLSRWRQDLLTRGWRVFENGPDQENRHLHERIGKLEQMVGKKEVELNLLKNFSDFYASRSSPS
jgi:transposase-like protein